MSFKFLVRTKQKGLTKIGIYMFVFALIFQSVALPIKPFTAIAAIEDEIVLHIKDGNITGTRWTSVVDATAAGTGTLYNTNLSEPKVSTPIASPTSYVDIAFTAPAGVKYHLWLRMKAYKNDYSNDSIYVQFSDSLNSNNAIDYRIGSTKAVSIVLEEGSGASVSGWGWNDSGYGNLGTDISFANSGSHTMRIQQREDGMYIDQVVLSAVKYLTTSPGLFKNDTTILSATQGSVTPTPTPTPPVPAPSPAPTPTPTPTPTPAPAPGPIENFKVANWNIKSGQGECMQTGACPFAETTQNCTDAALPLNAWGKGIPQTVLAALNADPAVVALGLQEAWGCGKPSNVKNALGWSYASSELNGLAIVTRYGIKGSLVSKLVSLPQRGEPRYVIGADVCLNSVCANIARVYVTHLGGIFGDATATTSHIDGDLDTVPQLENLVNFINSQPLNTQHVVTGDFNLYDMEVAADYKCEPTRNSPGLPYFRNAGYTDAWRFLKGNALGMTGMMNRECGIVNGSPYKRIDYSWSKGLVPVSIALFANVPPAAPAPSDHLGIVTEYSVAGIVPPATSNPPMPPGVTLTASASAITAGTPVILTWTSTNSESAMLNKVPVALSGSTVVNPIVDTLYTFTAKNTGGGTNFYTVFVDVTGVPIPTPPAPTPTPTTPPPAPTPTPTPIPGVATEVVIRPAESTSLNLVGARWTTTTDATAAGGKALLNPNLNQAKVGTALAVPTSYAEFTFNAEANVNYHIWFRMKGQNNDYSNDSVYVQFSDSLNHLGGVDYRIGTDKALGMVLEEGSGAGISGWGWNDNGYGILGGHVRFATSGVHTIRIQQREDGTLIDQVVFSPVNHLVLSPGLFKMDNIILAPTQQ